MRRRAAGRSDFAISESLPDFASAAFAARNIQMLPVRRRRAGLERGGDGGHGATPLRRTRMKARLS